MVRDPEGSSVKFPLKLPMVFPAKTILPTSIFPGVIAVTSIPLVT